MERATCFPGELRVVLLLYKSEETTLENNFSKKVSIWLAELELQSSYPTLQARNSLRITPKNKKGGHTSFMQNGSPLALHFSHQFLRLQRNLLLRRGVTTPSMTSLQDIPKYHEREGHMKRVECSIKVIK